ncbi:hypothetical protein GCM10010324_15850 [Streptomyces hiroshimensis]|uniref:Uncharacterized protein n=1 Tax=Streptomyces hiroshimensis TaxID=66424 RepID=A0ABQ2Y7V2_9ACTN|nr:hypothetical protein GCM10010324_15850 [Streptomyces hiroshimensis]
MPVAQETSGQSFITEQASNPRVMESPSEAMDSGRVFHAGAAGEALGFPAEVSPPPLSQPVTSRAAEKAETVATTALAAARTFRTVLRRIAFSPPAG